MRAKFLLAGIGLIGAFGQGLAQLPGGPAYPALPTPIPDLPTSPGTSLPPGALPPLSPLRPSSPTQPQYPAIPSMPQPQNPYGSPYGPASPLYPQQPRVGYPAPQQVVPAGMTQYPGTDPANPIAQPQQFPLPQQENKFTMSATDVSVKKVAAGWQLWVGQRLLRDFGDHEMDARDAARVLRDLRPNEWVIIGRSKSTIEYGLVNGQTPTPPPNPGQEDPNSPRQGFGDNRPTATGAGARIILPIDLRSVRVEAIRGVWCLRDDATLHHNFGLNKADAEQALAAIRKYGFNRMGIVGNPVPLMTYLFSGADTTGLDPNNPFVRAALQAQIDGLARVGIPIAGLGYVGEMIRFDPQRLELRKEGIDWVIATGTEVIGRYGPAEWVARDALRTIQDARFTEFCRLGSAGITFFLVNGAAPTRVPFSVQGRAFDVSALKVQKNGERFAVAENGRQLYPCATPEEGETIIRVLKHFGFDQLCHLGPTPRLGVSFLARTR